MASLEQSLEFLMNRHVAAMDQLHDYRHTNHVLWRLLQVDVRRRNRRLYVRNRTTGSRADEQELVARSQASLKTLNEECFKRLVSEFESFFFEVLRAWLSRDPAQIEERQVEVRLIAACSTLEEVRVALASSTLESIKYKRLAEWFGFLAKVLRYAPLPDSRVEELAEIKARRDVIEHNGGVVNEIYLRKAGTKARFAAGDAASVTEADFEVAFAAVRQAVIDIGNSAKVRARAEGL